MLRIACASIAIALLGCGERAQPQERAESSSVGENVVATASASSEKAWRPFSESERRALCSKKTKVTRSACDADAKIEELLTSECATDSPMWQCPNVSAADLEACWAVEPKEDDISDGCKALDAKMTVCGVHERIRKQCPMLMRKVTAGGPAEKAGIVEGDRLVEVDGKPFGALDDLAKAVNASAGAPMRLRVRHASEGEATVTVTPAKEKNGRYKIGVVFDRPPECPYLNTYRVLPCRAGDPKSP